MCSTSTRHRRDVIATPLPSSITQEHARECSLSRAKQHGGSRDESIAGLSQTQVHHRVPCRNCAAFLIAFHNDSSVASPLETTSNTIARYVLPTTLCGSCCFQLHKLRPPDTTTRSLQQWSRCVCSPCLRSSVPSIAQVHVHTRCITIQRESE